ncbi:hypothetical protein [Lentibacillus sp. Marseille-P4043]|uniref:hypothetical protein n=1 Tax=Lentibacillus sp. Marseille-P4043 TaxID=2040293 RepID=UPI000D0B4E7E|nr:hypothetical protein [Lentibacillus sp. Marseille-P4043]
MSKIFQFTILIVFIFLAGCNGISNYDDNEVAAIVKGQEITVGDLRFLYPDDTALDYLEWAINVELVKQEVKDMNLDVSDNLEGADDWFRELPPKNTKDEGGKQIRKFAESQAKKLDMKPEEFQRDYAKRIDEQNAYITTYLEEKLGEAELNDEKWAEESHEKVDYLLEELVEENEEEIEVLID